MVAALALSSLTGCFSNTRPAVRIVGADLVQRTDQGVVFDVQIEGANHTNKDLKLQSVDYWMDMEGVRVFEGQRSPQTTFSALSAQSFKVPVAVAIQFVPQADQANFSFGATITYLLPGPLARAMNDLGLRQTQVNVRGAGLVELGPDKADSP